MRAWLTLKSCTNDFQVELIRLGHKTSKDALLSSNPSGKIPCLVDQSCQALFTWAPVADELKQYDEEIVLNSMALKWNNIVSDFKKLINY